MDDQVLIKQKRLNMLTPYYDSRPFTLIVVKGSRIADARGSEVKKMRQRQTRNIQLRYLEKITHLRQQMKRERASTKPIRNRVEEQVHS